MILTKIPTCVCVCVCVCEFPIIQIPTYERVYKVNFLAYRENRWRDESTEIGTHVQGRFVW